MESGRYWAALTLHNVYNNNRMTRNDLFAHFTSAIFHVRRVSKVESCAFFLREICAAGVLNSATAIIAHIF